MSHEEQNTYSLNDKNQLPTDIMLKILDDIPVLIAAHNRDNYIVWANKQYRETLGMELNELCKMKCYEAWNLGKICVMCPVVKAFKDGKYHESILTPWNQVHWPDDQGCWISKAMPIKDANGSTAFVIESTINITDRMNAEKTLEAERNKFSDYFEKAPFGVFIADNEGNYKQINESACKMTGYTKDELLTMNLAQLIPESERQTAIDHFNTLKSSSEPTKTEICYQRKDGTIRYWQVTAAKLSDNELLGYTEDITQRLENDKQLQETLEELRASEEELKVSEEQLIDQAETLIKNNNELKREKDERNQILRTMLNSFVLFESVFDENNNFISYRFVYINKSYEDITGVTLDEVKGKTVHEVWPETEPEWIRRYGEVAVSGIPQEFELFHEPTNKLYHCRVYRPFETNERFCVIFEDITDIRRKQQEDLKMQKLESLGVLAGGIAHDFNNLLTAILGNITIAKNECSDETRDILIDAEQASLRAKKLTNRLITFSKGGTPVKEKLDIGVLIKDAADFTLRGSNVQCKIDICENLWPVKADSGQIEQVINNLVLNASQSMPEGGNIKISVCNTVVEDSDEIDINPGAYISVTVKDHGIGIADHYIDKIFDPYFTTKNMGSGLGLSSVYSIIKNHDGLITVDSVLDEGTSFTVYLPALSGDVSSKDKIQFDDRTGMEKKCGTVLIMDDNELVLDVVNKFIKRSNWNAVLVKNGIEAIEEYRKAYEHKQPFDAVILDLTIPGGMGGEMVIKQLMEIDPKVKGIVSSGYSTNPVMSNYKKYGFINKLPKPYHKKIFFNVLDKCLGPG